jgi:N-acetylglucosaminyl-diphospho-decaprenol L-rhamnosyltransferase
MSNSLPTPTKDDRISVVMVSYMTGPALMESIQAVQNDADIHELIIVDNGNTAADRARLFQAAQRSEKVRILQGHGNVGFARGCNYGAALATGENLFFLNPDAIIEVGAARKLVEAGKTVQTPWIAGGMLLNSNGQEQRGARRGPLNFGSAIVSFTPLHHLPGIQSIHRDDEPLPDGPVPMPTVSGASIMTDRISFDRIGGFDGGYFLHVEDIAICRAARQAGGSVIFVPDARAMHHGSTSDVARLWVEWHKLKGFLRYFWTSGSGAGSKMATLLVAPIMAAMLSARFVILSLRKALRGP